MNLYNYYLFVLCICITATTGGMETQTLHAQTTDGIPSSLITGKQEGEPYTDLADRHIEKVKEILGILNKPYDTITTEAIVDISKVAIVKEPICETTLLLPIRRPSQSHFHKIRQSLKAYPSHKPLKALETTIINMFTL